MGRPRHRRLLRRARPPVIARDIVPEKVEALSRGEIDDPRAWPRRAAEAQRRAPHLHDRHGGRCSRPRRCSSSASTRRRPRPATPTSRGCARCRGAARRRRPRAGDEEHRARRHRPDRSAATCPASPYVSCPEFLKEGSAVEDFLHPDRVVIGADPGDEAAGDAVARLYEPLGGEIVRTDVASAEMIKLASNAFLATKISFVNEIANVCEEVGADVAEVARGMGLDQRIGPAFLRAGIGYGGSCFPKDVSALRCSPVTPATTSSCSSAVIEVNELQKRRVVKQASEAPRLAARQARGAARPGLQAAHRRHARGLEPGAGGAAAGRGGRGGRLRSRRRDVARGLLGSSSSATRRWRRSMAPTPRSWSPSGPSSPSSTGPSRPSGWRGRC